MVEPAERDGPSPFRVSYAEEYVNNDAYVLARFTRMFYLGEKQTVLRIRNTTHHKVFNTKKKQSTTTSF